MIARSPHRRQVGIPDAPTNVPGITDSAKVVDAAAPTGSALVFDTAAPAGAEGSAPPLQPGKEAVTITEPATATTTTPTQTPTSVENTAASSKSISMSTVIGACVGAFIGAAAFILLAIYFYRRYSQSLKQRHYRRGAPRSAYNDARNSRADIDRRRSKAEAWDKLDDGDTEDKWEGMNSGKRPVNREVKEMDTLPPSSMGMFQKTSSSLSHSNYNSAEDSPTTAAFKMSHPYASSQGAVPDAKDLLGREPQHLLSQIDSGPPLSWGDSKSSFLSSTRLSGGAMSPSLSMAIPTPPAVKTEVHHWESAEVVHYSETAEVVNQRQSKGLANPFFNAVEYHPAPLSGGSNSSSSYQSAHSRNSSNATIQQADVVASNAKGKERVVSIDPFRDPLPKPKFINHIATSSTSSSDNERAIRQLVAAASLDDLSEDEVQRRLRVASMQPSIISYSGDSMYTDAEPDPVDEAMMRSFPVPPSSSGHETQATHAASTHK